MMILEGLELNKLSYLLSQQVEQVTCLECCKTYIAPETAPCGHTLCHVCWKKRRTCPLCSSAVNRQATKLNLPLQNLTEHINALAEIYEKLFNVKLDEFMLDTPGEFASENDPAKHVKEWLASSQNKFSAPVATSGQTPQEKLPVVEVHTLKERVVDTCTMVLTKPAKVVSTAIAQDDWDKIESMPETENKDKENIIDPTEIEPFPVDDNFYTIQNPRRSSRKKEDKITDFIKKKPQPHPEKLNMIESSSESDIKTNNVKQSWNNVKRMKKEFSKLNKKNKNKLNVSIEMYKKTQHSYNKSNIDIPAAVSEQILEIDDNTPNIENNEQNNDLRMVANHGQGDGNFDAEISNKNSLNDPNSIELNINSKKSLKNNTPELSAIYANSITETDHNVKFSHYNPLSNNKRQYQKRNFIRETNNSKILFIKKGPFCPKPDKCKCNTETFNHYIGGKTGIMNSNNIQISIKIGDRLTNIFINNDKNDSPLKACVDREIQASLGPYNISEKNDFVNASIQVQENKMSNNEKALQVTVNTNNKSFVIAREELVSTKKNTASAETAAAQFEITESVERELSKIMECDNVNNKEKQNTQVDLSQILNTSAKDAQIFDDLQILNNSKTKNNNVQLLRNTKQVSSEILLPSTHTKRHKNADKRNRENNDQDIPKSKKMKTIHEKNGEMQSMPTTQTNENINRENDSEVITYEAVLDRVFANIDMDIENKDTDTQYAKNKQATHKKDLSQTQISKIVSIPSSIQAEPLTNHKNYYNQKDSENIFSIVEKENENNETTMKNNGSVSTQQHIQDLLTPVMCRNLELNEYTPHDVDRDDGSDRSIVEDTPQKNISYTKLRQNNGSTKKELEPSEKLMQPDHIDKKSFGGEKTKSVINLTESVEFNNNNKDGTVIECVPKKHTLETPLTINKFVDHIKHKSTPVARKSLNFEKENMDVEDPEVTLCPTSEVAKNTQEKEFMSKAFENTPGSPRIQSLTLKSFNSLNNKKMCIAGSCLTTHEITKLKNLCSLRKWTYVDKYTKNLTHLVVGIDEENKSQRSVKYMSALAAGKWIVSFEWVEKCLKATKWVDEVHYEVLDSTGEPGPKRSRIAKHKLFQGITFYCMPPFSVLDVNTLKAMLEAAGGRVVNELKQVAVTEDMPGPALLLAEPENTQEDRFIYLTVELGIVPVNYEWVLNSLGNYTLGSLQDLLLCPMTLLPKVTSQWPSCFFTREYDE